MKILVVSFMILLIVSSAQAQYKTYKNKYDVKEYKYQSTDRYNPTAACLMSIIPGLGHCYIGEPVRGFGFFALTYGSVILTGYGLSQAYNSNNKDKAGWMVGGGTLIFIGSYIWSIANVTRMAKIKNMNLRDNNITMHFYPSIQSNDYVNTGMTYSTGATLTIKF